ncbi:MAG: C45 family autoproteolytic acyltransferase/hydrolase [Candidatus Nomurabacteria bacterium]|jgi:predicted choloylglycine hydrolase|nr:C45 family autoproteolytic acyltransferase/hydrolase [Candidatus Nomurabacteria bacterium]
MRTLKFTGNSYEIGRELEEHYREWHQDLPTDINRRTLSRQLAIYRKHFPSLIEEIRGMADEATGEGSYEKLLYSVLAHGVDNMRVRPPETKGCTIFGVKTPSGLIVGRNYDWIPQARDAFHIYNMNITGRYSYTGISDMNIYKRRHASHKHWSFSAEDTINEKGLYIGLTFAHNPRFGYGLSSTHMIRLIAETCATVDEALKVFRKVPLMIAKNFFVADASGNMAIVEHNSKIFKVLRPDERGILIQTNHYLAPELAREDFCLKECPAHDTYVRYYEALCGINRAGKDFNATYAHKILRKSPYIYANDPDGFMTIWSLVLDMTAKHYHLVFDTASCERTMEILP